LLPEREGGSAVPPPRERVLRSSVEFRAFAFGGAAVALRVPACSGRLRL